MVSPLTGIKPGNPDPDEMVVKIATIEEDIALIRAQLSGFVRPDGTFHFDYFTARSADFDGDPYFEVAGEISNANLWQGAGMYWYSDDGITRTGYIDMSAATVMELVYPVDGTLNIDLKSQEKDANQKVVIISAYGFNSTPAEHEYGQLAFVIDDPTAGSEDSSIYLKTYGDGVLAETMKLGGGGDAQVNLYFETNLESQNNELFRMHIRGLNSVQAGTQYAEIYVKIDDSVNNTEDGQIGFTVMRAGNLTDVVNIQSTKVTIDADLEFSGPQAIRTSSGDLTLVPDGNDVIFSNARLSFNAVAEIWAITQDFHLTLGTGRLVAEYTSTTFDTVFELGSKRKTAGNEVSRMEFRGWDDADAEQTYGMIAGLIVDPAAASIDGRLSFYTWVANTKTEMLRLTDGITFFGAVVYSADLKLHSGADLIVYSDAGSTEKARIDGATGNITTAGTVDGIDIATDVAANTTHRGSVGADHSYIDQDVTVAATPTFADVFVPDGGMYGIASNELLTFNAAGTAVFSGCDVGIGATPDAKLEVMADGAAAALKIS